MAVSAYLRACGAYRRSLDATFNVSLKEVASLKAAMDELKEQITTTDTGLLSN